MKKAAKNDKLPVAAHNSQSGDEILGLHNSLIKDRDKNAMDCPFAGTSRCTGACGKHH